MRIKIELNKKSIANAINRLNNLKSQIDNEMLPEFFSECYRFFIDRCSDYLGVSSVGENVKDDINSSWHYEPTKNGAKIYNDSIKAVFVEFGVGMIGQENKHNNADSQGYKYNIGAKINDDGYWIFNATDDEEIDIQREFIENRTAHTVKTKGSPAIMYAYNALEDLRIQCPIIWENIKIKYWGIS